MWEEKIIFDVNLFRDAGTKTFEPKFITFELKQIQWEKKNIAGQSKHGSLGKARFDLTQYIGQKEMENEIYSVRLSKKKKIMLLFRVKSQYLKIGALRIVSDKSKEQKSVEFQEIEEGGDKLFGRYEDITQAIDPTERHTYTGSIEDESTSLKKSENNEGSETLQKKIVALENELEAKNIQLEQAKQSIEFFDKKLRKYKKEKANAVKARETITDDTFEMSQGEIMSDSTTNDAASMRNTIEYLRRENSTLKKEIKKAKHHDTEDPKENGENGKKIKHSLTVSASGRRKKAVRNQDNLGRRHTNLFIENISTGESPEGDKDEPKESKPTTIKFHKNRRLSIPGKSRANELKDKPPDSPSRKHMAPTRSVRLQLSSTNGNSNTEETSHGLLESMAQIKDLNQNVSSLRRQVFETESSLKKYKEENAALKKQAELNEIVTNAVYWSKYDFTDKLEPSAVGQIVNDDKIAKDIIESVTKAINRVCDQPYHSRYSRLCYWISAVTFLRVRWETRTDTGLEAQKKQLVLLLDTIFSMLLGTFIREIRNKAILAFTAKNGDIKGLTSALTTLLTTMKRNRIFYTFIKSLFGYVFDVINSALCNKMFNSDTLCTYGRVLTMKMKISEFENTLNRERIYKDILRDSKRTLLRGLIDVINVIMLPNKQSLLEEECSKAICPTLNEVQIRQLVENFNPDDFNPEPIRDDVLAAFRRQSMSALNVLMKDKTPNFVLRYDWDDHTIKQELEYCA